MHLVVVFMIYDSILFIQDIFSSSAMMFVYDLLFAKIDAPGVIASNRIQLPPLHYINTKIREDLGH